MTKSEFLEAFQDVLQRDDAVVETMVLAEGMAASAAETTIPERTL